MFHHPGMPSRGARRPRHPFQMETSDQDATLLNHRRPGLFQAWQNEVSIAENTCCPLLQDGTETSPRFTGPDDLPGAEQLVKEILNQLGRCHLVLSCQPPRLPTSTRPILPAFSNPRPCFAPFNSRLGPRRLVTGFKKEVPYSAKSDNTDA